MSDNWDEINRRAELVEVLTSIMERIYPVWVADTRAGELVEALEKWLDSRIENIDGGPADETAAVLADSAALASLVHVGVNEGDLMRRNADGTVTVIASGGTA